jgi:hypothetical protein
VDGQDHIFFGLCFLVIKDCVVPIVIRLCKNDFMSGYEVWKFQDELGTRVIVEDEQDYDPRVDRMDEMLEPIQAKVIEGPPIAEVEAFFKLRKSR